MDAELFEQMIASVGVGVGVYTESGQYIYVNEAYAEMLDTAVDDLVGTPIWEVNRRIDSDRFDEYWNSFGPGETRTAEAVHECGQTSVDVQTITTRTEIDGQTYHIGTIQDIGLRKRRERQLSKLHEVARDLFAADSETAIAALTADTVESILEYDRTVVRFHTETGELVPVAVSQTVQDDLGPRPSYHVDGETPVARAYRTGDPVVVADVSEIDDEIDRGESRSIMYLPIGEYGVLSVSDSQVGKFDPTEVDLAMILAANANTALRRLENERDLERKNERLEAFVDVISHDIPNHLTVAGTRLELARSDGDLSHLAHVAQAHDRIESLIADMRTLVDHGSQITDMEWLRFEDLVDACWRGCQEAGTTGELEADVDGYLRADESRLKQLLENLFWNAMDHAGPDPTVRIGRLDDGFYVEDDGPGIPPEEHENVLAPGFTTAEGNDDHSGFGLAIVREIVRAHGWSIDLAEGEEGGARFEITGVQFRSDDHA